MTDPSSLFPPGVTARISSSILPDRDPRAVALAQLRQYISLLTFSRTMARDERARAFRVHRTSIHLYQPDSPREMNLPSIAFLPGPGETVGYGLGPAEPCEGSVGIAGPGTALVSLGEYTETLTIEVIAGKQATRRAIVAGLRAAFSPHEETSSLRLALPGLYGAVAEFTLTPTTYIDEAQASLNRRRAQLSVVLRVPDLRIVRVAQFRPQVSVVVSEVTDVAEVPTPAPVVSAPGARVFDSTFDSTFA